jgi:hypothetical protein
VATDASNGTIAAAVATFERRSDVHPCPENASMPSMPAEPRRDVQNQAHEEAIRAKCAAAILDLELARERADNARDRALLDAALRAVWAAAHLLYDPA